MGEDADIKLARVEATLQSLVEEVRKLRVSAEDMIARVIRLEEATRESIPEIWPLRDRVAQVECETADLRLRLQELQKEQDSARHTTGNRWWDLAKIVLSPAVAAAVAWLLMRR